MHAKDIYEIKGDGKWKQHKSTTIMHDISMEPLY